MDTTENCGATVLATLTVVESRNRSVCSEPTCNHRRQELVRAVLQYVRRGVRDWRTAGALGKPAATTVDAVADAISGSFCDSHIRGPQWQWLPSRLVTAGCCDGVGLPHWATWYRAETRCGTRRGEAFRWRRCGPTCQYRETLGDVVLLQACLCAVPANSSSIGSQLVCKHRLPSSTHRTSKLRCAQRFWGV